MAGAAKSQAAESTNYVEYDEYVDFQIEKTRAIVKRTEILTTAMALSVGVIAYLLVFVICDQWVIAGGFSDLARGVLLTLVLAVVLGVTAWRIVWPLLRHIHPLYAARVIERSDPRFQSNLVNFVDVKLANAESAPLVMKSMQKRAAVELSTIDVEEAVDHRPLLRIAYALLTVVVISALYIFLSPKDVFVSVWRALIPTSSLAVATRTMITEVDPGDKDVPARTRQIITAEIRGEDAEQAQILFTTADHKYVDEPVRMRRETAGLSKFVGELNGENGKGLLQSLTYRIVAGDARSKDYRIQVIQSPSARVEEVDYVFPKYTELPEKTLSGGDIDGWEGTIVTVRAVANMPVSRATLVLTDTDDRASQGEEYSMQVADGTQLTGTWKLEFRSDGSAPRFYHIEVRTENQKKDEIQSDPTQYSLRIRPDQRPEVALLDPTTDLVRPANGVIPLVVQAADPDFKVRAIMLRGTRGPDPLFNQDVKLFEDELPARSFNGQYRFRLEPLGLKPGEKIQFWVEARDNKQPTANRATSAAINVTIDKPVSSQEVQRQLARDEKNQQDQLAQADLENNPGSDAGSEPATRGDDASGDQRATRPQPGEAPPPNTGDADPTGPDERADPAPGESGDADSPPRKPASPEEALSRLLKKSAPQDADQEPSAEEPESQSRTTEPQRDSAADNQGAGGSRGGSGQSKNRKQQGSRPSDDAGDQGEDTSPAGEGAGQSGDSGDNAADSDSATGTQKQQSRGPSQSQRGDEGTASSSGQDESPPSSAKNPKQPSASDKPAREQGDSDAGTRTGGQKKNKPQSDAQNSSKTEQSAERGDKSGTGSDSEDAPQPSDSPKDRSSPKGGRDDKSRRNSDDQPTDGTGEPQDAAGDREQESSTDKSGTAPAKKSGTGGTGNQNKPEHKDTTPPAVDQGAGSDSDSHPAADKPGGEQPPAGKKPEAGKPDKAKPEKNGQKNPQSGGTAGPSDQQGDESGQDQDANEGSSGDSGAGATKSPPPGAGNQAPKRGQGESRQGPRKPAADDPDATDKPATGDEPGEAHPDPNGSGNETPRPRTKKNSKGSEQGSRQPGSHDDAADSENRSRQPGEDEGADGGTDDAEAARRAPDGKKQGERPGKLGDPPSEKGVPRREDRSAKRPGQPPDVGNQQLRGTGRKDGQKSEQSDAGEQGEGAASDQGQPGANKTGPGDQSDEQGATDSASEKTGQTGGKKKGAGSSSRPGGEGKPSESGSAGEEPGKGGPGKSTKGSQSGKPGAPGAEDSGASSESSESSQGNGGGSGKGNSKSSNSAQQAAGPGQPAATGTASQRSGGGATSVPTGANSPANAGTQADAEGPSQGAGSREAPPEGDADEADFESARKATNLVLQRLKSQLERGEVDQAMLDELGWKGRQDVEKFVRYLENNLTGPTDEDSPEAEARRMQFEETLRNLDLSRETQRRAGSVGKQRTIDQVGTKTTRPPREYQKIWESYTRSLSKTGEQADPKARSEKPADNSAKPSTKRPAGK